jgi:acyl-CoA synthetase (NDP forming)
MTDTTFTTVHPGDSARPDDLLTEVFNPPSIALIGASDNPTKLITYRPIEYLRRYGYTGRIYPINPKYQTVQGLPAYPSVHDTPTPPQAVIVALPRHHVVAALEECAAVGTRVAIVYSSGFSEVPDGLDLHQELSAFANRTGMRIIGPNCQGIATLGTGFFPCFSTAFATDPPETGSTAIISQSGAVAAMIYNRWTAVGGGAKYWASTGNEADLTVARLARAAIEDPDIENLLLYMESVRDRPVLEQLVGRAAELGKHVVVYRPAGTERGWLAASRHTGAGAIAGDHLGAAVPTGTHVHSARSLDELVALAQLVSSGKTVSGGKLAIISNSGGLGVMAADTATRAGFSLEPLSAKSQDELASILPGFASVLNPIDVTAQLLNDGKLLAKALPTVLADDQVDATVVALGAVGDGYDVDQIQEDVARAHAESGKLVIVVWVGSRVDVRRRFGRLGIPVFDSVPLAIDALATYRQATTSPTAETVRPGPPRPAFDDLFVGARYESEAVRIEEDKLDLYAGVAEQTGDATNVHVDLGAARAAGHPARLVSGLHTLTHVTILGARMGLWEHSTLVAGFGDVRFTKPVYEGDRIKVALTVRNLKPLKGTSERGLVTFDFRLSTARQDDTFSPVATGLVDYVYTVGGK